MKAPPTVNLASRRIVFYAATLAIITYVDRVCISQAAPSMREALGLNAAQMGLAFSAFGWAYAIFEIPGGWLGDRIGPRKVLLRVVVLWSVFTAATGCVWNLASLLLARFCFGMGEAGCFPNLTKAFALWLPRDQRTRAQSILWMSARWGGAFTPLLVIWVMAWLSWRKTFVLFGLTGLIWAWFFHRRFRDQPGEQPGGKAAGLEPVSARETAPAGGTHVPWRCLLSSRSVWLLWGQYFCLTYGWFFYITWLPTYLKEARGLALEQNAVMLWVAESLRGSISAGMAHQIVMAALAGVPLFLGGLGAILAGFLTPRLAVATGSVARARRMFALLGFGGAGVLLVWSFYIQDPLLAMLVMGMAGFCNDLTMPGSWTTCMDLGGRFAGTLSGGMNMMGSVGAAIAPLAIGLLLDFSDHNWAFTFWMSGIIYLLGGLCWLGIDPVRSAAGEGE